MKTTFNLTSFICISIFLLSTLSLKAQWDTEVRMTDAPGYSLTSLSNQRNIATSGNNVHMVYYDQRDAQPPYTIESQFEVYYRLSTDDGTTFGTEQRLTFGSDIDRSINPSIAVSGSVIHVIYDAKRNSGANREVCYMRSDDNGATWSAEISLTSGVSMQTNASIASSGSYVHVAYYDNSAGNYEIFHLRSSNGGNTWSAPARMTNNSGNSDSPCLAASGSKVYLVWADFSSGKWELFFRKSTNNGQSFSNALRITGTPADDARYPSLTVSGNYIHVVFSELSSGNIRLRYVVSNNDGGKWSKETQLVSSTYTNFVYMPSITSSGSDVHLGYAFACGYIYYKKSTNNGTSWQGTVSLTPQGYHCRPSIAVSGSTVHMLYYNNAEYLPESSGNVEVWYRRNTNNGSAPFIEPQKDNIGTPEVFELSQNYPNPFNPSTSISFNIPVSGYTTLKIFDITGKEVAELVNGELNEGSHSFLFNAENLATGVYYYRLESSGNVDVKKMMLVK
jgi:hypothetical protein